MSIELDTYTSATLHEEPSLVSRQDYGPAVFLPL